MAKEKETDQPSGAGSDDTPIGLLPDGSIACYAPGQVPPYEPEIVGGDEPEDEVEEDGEDLGDV